MNLLRASIGVFVLCLFTIAVCSPATAQQSDPSVEPFWAKFKAAVLKTDKASVASMTRFPIEMPYGVPKIRNRTQLVRRWRDLFNVQANAVKCFEDAKPTVEPAAPNRFTVGCKDEAGNEVVVYGFLRTRSGWKLTFLDNINE
ncbi:MAG TPA: hypothetical protein VJV21_00940 [Pyrinomonadaceae bacterium]|nr:hypothetical protein [Pyrinomonadaceae bacterium]